MKIRPSAAIVSNNKILLMRYHYSGNDVFQLPGGNMEEVETLEQTLAREYKEELQVSIGVGELLLTAQVINTAKSKATLHCVFKGSILNNEVPTINKTETSALEVVWMELDKLPTLNLYPSVAKALIMQLESASPYPSYLGLIEQPWW